jgi:hypothetical protein
MFNYFINNSLDKFLFGIGFGNSINYIGIGSHNFLVTHLLESGVFGALIFGILIIHPIIKCKGQNLIVIIPFLLNSMSVASHAMSFLLAFIAISTSMVINNK